MAKVWVFSLTGTPAGFGQMEKKKTIFLKGWGKSFSEIVTQLYNIVQHCLELAAIL